MSKVLNLLTLFCLLAFITGFSGGKKSNISGKWYYKSNGTYTTSQKDTRSLAHWYHFKKKSKILFSTCTDICGCMRTTYYGNWTWENDSTIAITYKRAKRFNNEMYRLPKIRQERISIKRINATTLQIESVIQTSKE